MAREIKTNFVADSTINQLILLRILEKIEIPLAESSLIDICTAKERKWLSYLDFKEVLNKLLEFNFISKVIVDNEFEKERYKTLFFKKIKLWWNIFFDKNNQI